MGAELTASERMALIERRGKLEAVLQSTKDEIRSVDFLLSRDRQHRAAVLAATSRDAIRERRSASVVDGRIPRGDRDVDDTGEGEVA